MVSADRDPPYPPDVVTGNVPGALPPLIGRHRELRALAGRLGEARLVTLTGVGGSGKTLLALHAAQAARPRFPGGVWLCALGPVTDPALVPVSVATSLGVRSSVADEPLTYLASFFGGPAALLILDSCEHVLAAVAGLADALLERCPALALLATSLRPLGLPTEQRWPVGPLAAPPRDDASASRIGAHPAVALFVARARASLPDFQLTDENAALVASICRRTAGLPLAIELAAARVGTLALEQIDQRLAGDMALLGRAGQRPFTRAADDRRHQTMRTTLAWGYALLGADEQRLLRMLSVFPSQFPLTGVEALWCMEPADRPLPDLVAGLVETGFVTTDSLPAYGEARYRLLDPVRHFAREELEQSGEAPAIRDRQLVWALSLAEALAPQLLGAGAEQAVIRLEQEYDSLRTALRWSISARRREAGMRLVSALFRFWFSHSAISEGRAWAEELLNLPDDHDPVPALVRARAAFVSGRLACRQGDNRLAGRRGAESLALARDAGDRQEEARALDLLGLVAHDLNDTAQAIAHHREALAIRRSLDDDYAVAVSLNNLGLVHFDCADYPAAAECFAAAAASAARAGVVLRPALLNLAEIALADDDPDTAESYVNQVFAGADATGDRHAVAGGLRIRGVAARLRGDLMAAERHGRQAADLYRAMHLPYWVGDATRDLGDLEVQRGALESARQAYAAALEAYRAAASVRGIAGAHARLGLLSALEGRSAGALAHSRQALALLEGTPHRHVLVEALEAAAAAYAGDLPEHAARLLDCVERARCHPGLRRLPPWRDWLNTLAERLRPQAGHSLRELSLDEAAALVRGVFPSAPAAPPLPRLRACALGPAQVHVDSQEIQPTAWTYRKARELFFLLLDRSSLTRLEIGAELWPDAAPDQLRNYLHRSLYFIRRATGDAVRITFSNGRYLIERDPPVWYDVAIFEQLLRQAQGAIPETLRAEQRAGRRALLEEALALWRGDFLADLDPGEWAIVRREELRLAYLQGLLDLGHLYLLDASYIRAAAAYQRVLAEDPLLELAHREWMRCMARQGERSQAVRQYHQLCDMLARELDTTPSYETTVLYERIRRGDDV